MGLVIAPQDTDFVSDHGIVSIKQYVVDLGGNCLETRGVDNF
jgi:hypothetical protein